MVRIELTDEVNMLKQREKEKRELESAFAQAHFENNELRVADTLIRKFNGYLLYLNSFL